MTDETRKQLEFTAGVLEREAAVIRAAIEEIERLKAEATAKDLTIKQCCYLRDQAMEWVKELIASHASLRAANAGLLAACEAVLRTFEAGDNAQSGAETLDLVEAAISKAKGQTAS